MINIIIAKEENFFRKSLKSLRETSSQIHVIASVDSGAEVIRLCEDRLPDVVLMGIQLPIMNGIQATWEIKTRWPQVKVIILTKFQDTNHVRNALKAGAEGYILKTAEAEFLVNGIVLVFHGGTLIPQHLSKEVFLTVLAAENGSGKLSPSTPYKLNDQELKVLAYLVQGISNKGISELMFLSLGTVKNYVSAIYSKLNVKNRSSAVRKAIDERLVSVKQP